MAASIHDNIDSSSTINGSHEISSSQQNRKYVWATALSYFLSSTASSRLLHIQPHWRGNSLPPTLELRHSLSKLQQPLLHERLPKCGATHRMLNGFTSSSRIGRRESSRTSFHRQGGLLPEYVHFTTSRTNYSTSRDQVLGRASHHKPAPLCNYA